MANNSSLPAETKLKKVKINISDYNISHTIGKGGSAIVKLGTHIDKKTNVVFKIYDKEQLKNSSRMKALQNEIAIMK